VLHDGRKVFNIEPVVIMRAILAILIASVISYISVKFWIWPFVWVFLSWWIVFLLQAQRTVRNIPRILCLNISGIILALAIVESALWIMDHRERIGKPRVILERVYEGKSDDILGYTEQRNTKRRAKRYVDGKLVYDVEISIDQNGLRISPPCSGKCENAVLFFGGSFTFGEGVNDDQTLPYRVGLETKQNYFVYNFGLYGYGPHQMLSAIERGLVARIVEQNVRYVVYQVLYPDHIYRLAGLRSWNRHDPKFILENHKQPHFVGHFDDQVCQTAFCIWADEQLQKSAVIKHFSGIKRDINENDKDLFFAVVIKTKELIVAKHPMAEFHLIVWDDGKERKDFEKLRGQDIKIHFIEKVLSGSDVPPSKLRISESEGHPNALAYRLMARYVAKHIIRE
jgi:hypothetical protein